MRGLNFSAPDASNIINAWVNDNTMGLIQSIVPDQIQAQTVMYLINAIYFKGTWVYRFDSTQTSDAPFHLPAGTTQSARLMRLEATLPYAATDAYQAVELPYGNGLFSMIVVLPRPGQSIETFVNNLNEISWNALLGGLQVQPGTVLLPKFKLEYEKVLNHMLMAMGMEIAFTGGADFTRIHPGGGLLISEVRHKTFIRVDEEGTEAAAVTSVSIDRTSSQAGFLMRIDRPFFFVITERHSKALLFMGKIVEPTM